MKNNNFLTLKRSIFWHYQKRSGKINSLLIITYINGCMWMPLYLYLSLFPHVVSTGKWSKLDLNPCDEWCRVKQRMQIESIKLEEYIAMWAPHASHHTTPRIENLIQRKTREPYIDTPVTTHVTYLATIWLIDATTYQLPVQIVVRV